MANRFCNVYMVSELDVSKLHIRRFPCIYRNSSRPFHVGQNIVIPLKAYEVKPRDQANAMSRLNTASRGFTIPLNAMMNNRATPPKAIFEASSTSF